MADLTINIFSHFITGIIFYRFMNRMLGRKYPALLVYFIMILWHLAESYVNLTLGIYKVFSQSVFFFLNDLAMGFVLFGGNMGKKFLTALLLQTGIISISAFVFIPAISYLSTQVNDPAKSDLLYQLCNVFIFLFSTAILEIIGRKFRHFTGNLPVHCCVYLFCLTVFITQSVVFICQSQQDNIRHQLPMVFLSTFCALAGMALILASIYYVDKRLSLSLSEQQNLLLKNHIDSLKRQDDHLRAFRHDLNNHFICLTSLLKAQHLNEAQVYLDHVVKTSRRIETITATGNVYADALLQEKKALADDKQIAMEIDMVLPPNISANAFDLCIILSNALDNALEACEKLHPNFSPKISVSAQAKQGFLMLEISNTIQGPLKIINNSLDTTKADKHVHGMGLNNIKAAVSRCGGDLKIYADKDLFTLSAILPL